MSDFEWDTAKAELNFKKHGIGFNDAAVALQGITITKMVQRHGETRLVSVCNWADRLIVVVWVQRLSGIRLISARRARPEEREQYRQEISKAAQAR